MNYLEILQKLYPEGSFGPGTGIYKGQCGAFVEALMNIPGGVGSTINSKTAAVKRLGFLAKQLQGGYDAGDVIVTKESLIFGHIAFVNNIIGDNLQLSESNYHLDRRVHHTRLINKYSPEIVGCIRGKLKFAVLDEKKNLTQQVLVLCKNIPFDQMGNLGQGITSYINKVWEKTDGQFTLNVDYKETTAVFIPVVQADGTVYLRADEIVSEAQKAANKQYDVVCLIYSDPSLNPKPNHPVQIPSIEHGFTTIQTPLDWISSINDPSVPFTIYSDSAEIFFAHEMTHADYYLANSKGANQRDKTHDPQVSGYPSPLDYFLNYLMELKPYWKYLAHEIP